MIRILQCVNDMHRAGLETMIMNYYRNIDRDKIQFDFLTHRAERSDYDDEIESMGGRMYYAPRLYPQNYPSYFRWMDHFFKAHNEFKIIHSHIDAMSYLPLLAARRSGIPIRIAHSHSTSIDKDFKYILKQFYRLRLNGVATHRFACGDAAGRFLFRGKAFQIIPNAVDARRFWFDCKLREHKRKELGLTDEFTVGHVGRFCYPKNHKFLIDILRQLLFKCPNSILLLAGVGEKEEEIKKYVSELGLQDKVRFLGNRTDVNELYQAMDVFVLPSLFEGVPMVGLEAQFSDLPCFFSDKVPTEVRFNEDVQFISLDSSAAQWAEAILKVKDRERMRNRPDIMNSKFDIKVAYQILERQYEQLYTNIF